MVSTADRSPAPALDKLASLLTDYAAMWKSDHGAAALDPPTLVSFFQDLKSDEPFWADYSRWQANHSGALDPAQLRAAIPTTLPPAAATLDDALASLPLPAEGRELVREALATDARREAVIRETFAQGTPAEIAGRLEQLVAADRSRIKLTDYLQTARPESAGITIGSLLQWLVAIAVIGLLAAIAMPKMLYKGVTPDYSRRRAGNVA